MLKAEDAHVRTSRAVENIKQRKVEPIGVKIAKKSDEGEYELTIGRMIQNRLFLLALQNADTLESLGYSIEIHQDQENVGGCVVIKW